MVLVLMDVEMFVIVSNIWSFTEKACDSILK